jgi:hypothetical protein
MNADKRSDDQAATAAYIASLMSSLADVARRQGLRDLTYLLDMARLEAESCARAERSRMEAEPPAAEQSSPDATEDVTPDEPDEPS